MVKILAKHTVEVTKIAVSVAFELKANVNTVRIRWPTS
jgi:hypothetical protein